MHIATFVLPEPAGPRQHEVCERPAVKRRRLEKHVDELPCFAFDAVDAIIWIVNNRSHACAFVFDRLFFDKCDPCSDFTHHVIYYDAEFWLFAGLVDPVDAG